MLNKGESMKYLLTYSSYTNNTKKVAQAMKERLNDAIYKPIEEVTQADIEASDAIIVGGWIDKGKMNKSVDEFIHNLHNKKVGFFFTLGAYPTSHHAYDCIIGLRKQFEDNGNQVISHFHCQGAISDEMMGFMKNLPAGHGHGVNPDRVNRWADAANHPSEEDFHAAQNFVTIFEKKLIQAMENDNV